MTNKQLLLLLGVGISLCSVLLLFVSDKGDMVLWLNEHRTTIADVLFKYGTHFGDGLMYIPILLFLFIYRKWYFFYLLSCGVFHGVVALIFKQWIFKGLPRPKAFFDEGVLSFVEGVKIHSSNSFPSGHTATAFSLAIALALIINRKSYTLLLFGLAIVAGVSRVYLSQHFLMDVTAGAMIGMTGSWGLWHFYFQKERQLLKKTSKVNTY
ncbi:phosphatase PAP2 family protein [Algivirga pacifica]|uniref:Phosphatidic acid phosphatase type 2/haloperoxidase domain-containing protein n=1 Tax=Algivirga pacifica TaxID=1162670 RepID=A0ABP9DFZ9_9BACT